MTSQMLLISRFFVLEKQTRGATSRPGNGNHAIIVNRFCVILLLSNAKVAAPIYTQISALEPKKMISFEK